MIFIASVIYETSPGYSSVHMYVSLLSCLYENLGQP